MFAGFHCGTYIDDTIAVFVGCGLCLLELTGLFGETCILGRHAADLSCELGDSTSEITIGRREFAVEFLGLTLERCRDTVELLGEFLRDISSLGCVLIHLCFQVILLFGQDIIGLLGFPGFHIDIHRPVKF